MTMPGGRLPNGYQQMGGGYEQSISTQQALQQQAQPQMPQTPLGQPVQMAQAPMPQMQPQGWFPAPQPQQAAPQMYNPAPMPQFNVPNQQQHAGYQPGSQGAPQFSQAPQQQQQPVPLQQNAPFNPAGSPVVQQGQGAGTFASQVLSGPGVPPELQGRTVQDLMQMNQSLRAAALAAMTGQAPQQQVQQQQPQRPQVQQSPMQQPASAQPSGFDWRNPTGSVQDAVREVIRSEVAPMLQPMVQSNMMSQAQLARNTVAQEIGPARYAQLEPMIHQALNGIDPRTLTDAQSWRIAAQIAAGQVALAPQPAAQQQQHAQQPGGYPVQQLNAFPQPVPNANQFFSEQPNNGQAMSGPGMGLSAEEQYFAAAMNMDQGTYAAWRGPRAR